MNASASAGLASAVAAPRRRCGGDE